MILRLVLVLRCSSKGPLLLYLVRDRSRISVKGVHIYKCDQRSRAFALLMLSHFNFSQRPKHYIFIGYLKTGVGEEGSSEPPEPPLNPPLILAL